MGSIRSGISSAGARLAVAVALASAGCAAPRTMTQAEWESSLVRDFSGVSRDQVLAAARRVFELADPADFRIVPTEDGILATRKWSWFLLIAATQGTDTWNLTAKDIGGVVRARVHVSVLTSDTNAAVIGAAAIPVTSTTQTPTVDGTAIYDVFWARVEYLLGQRDDWMSCVESNARQKSRLVWGFNEPLCDSLTTVDAPAPDRILGLEHR